MKRDYTFEIYNQTIYLTDVFRLHEAVDDELGALADIHQVLFEASVNVYASNGVTDNRGSFGYLLYIRPEEYERATSALKV